MGRPPDDTDHLGERLSNGLTRWSLDLDDPYVWISEAPGED